MKDMREIIDIRPSILKSNVDIHNRVWKTLREVYKLIRKMIE